MTWQQYVAFDDMTGTSLLHTIAESGGDAFHAMYEVLQDARFGGVKLKDYFRKYDRQDQTPSDYVFLREDFFCLDNMINDLGAPMPSFYHETLTSAYLLHVQQGELFVKGYVEGYAVEAPISEEAAAAATATAVATKEAEAKDVDTDTEEYIWPQHDKKRARCMEAEVAVQQVEEEDAETEDEEEAKQEQEEEEEEEEEDDWAEDAKLLAPFLEVANRTTGASHLHEAVIAAGDAAFEKCLRVLSNTNNDLCLKAFSTKDRRGNTPCDYALWSRRYDILDCISQLNALHVTVSSAELWAPYVEHMEDKDRAIERRRAEGFGRRMCD